MKIMQKIDIITYHLRPNSTVNGYEISELLSLAINNIW